MQAWQFSKTHEPLSLNEVPEPVAAAGEVLIDIKAAGLCHSDVGILEQEPMSLPPFTQEWPVTLGHEISGTISALGDGVTDWSIGDRVGIYLANDGTVPGLSRDGGYTTKIAAKASVIVSVPDSVTFEQAAAGTDAGVTAHYAVVKAGQARAGQKVGIIGLGGLGQIGARVAVLLGCEVYAAEIKEEVWTQAKALGIRRVVKDVIELADVGLDVIVDFAGIGNTTANAILAIKTGGGRIVQVGMGEADMTISRALLGFKEITITGTLGGDLDDLVSVYDLMASGDLDPVLTTIRFDEIPEGLAMLSRGEVAGRLVARIGEQTP